MAKKSNMQPGNIELAKLMQQSDNFGNTGIKNQQVTHRHLYHYLPFDGTTSLPFFQSVKTARPLFANIDENKLQPGEAMVIKEIFFDLIAETPTTNPPTLTASNDFNTGGVPGMYNSQLQWLNDNNRVVKTIGLQEMNPKFNKNAYNDTLNVISLKANITIMPLITFVGQLNTPTYAAVANVFMGMHVLGIGTILAPKSVY